jgi:8-oxo-dGTP pyrophosphatase MutT (NUDIX family)
LAIFALTTSSFMTEQNYTFFINQSAIILTNNSNGIGNEKAINDIHNFINDNIHNPYLNTDLELSVLNIENVLKEVIHSYNYIEAAGGLVLNQGKMLLIQRWAKWDLPKGKMEPNEKKEMAATREVEEECGIKKLKIVQELPPTYHFYLIQEKITFKKTYWFEMISEDFKMNLKPQIEEGITKVEFMPINFLAQHKDLTYRNLYEFILKVQPLLKNQS